MRLNMNQETKINKIKDYKKNSNRRDHARKSAIIAVAAFICFIFFVNEIAPFSKFARPGEIAKRDYIATGETYDIAASGAAVKKAKEGVSKVYDEDDEAFRSLQIRNERFLDALDHLKSDGEALRRQIIQSSEKDDEVQQYAEGNLSAYEWGRVLGDAGHTQLRRTYGEWFDDDEISKALSLSSSMYTGWTREITLLVSSQQRKGIMDDDLVETQEEFYASMINATPLSLQSTLERISKYCINPTMFFNKDKTEAAQDEAAKTTPKVLFEEGSIVVKKGEKIDDLSYKMLLENTLILTAGNIASTWIVGFAFYSLLLFLVLRVLYDSDKAFFRSFRLGLVYILILIGTAFATKIAFNFSPYANVAVLGALLVAQLYGVTLGSVFVVLITPIAMVMAVGGNFAHSGLLLQTLVATSIGLFAGVITVQRATKRSSVLFGAIAAGFGMLSVCAFSATVQKWETSEFIAGGVTSFVTCLASGVIVLGIMPLFEVLFDFSTPFRLREYCDFNHPLLRRLMLEAPGTYNHSIMVANMCEACANAIDVDPILSRVGAYFHDIGKLSRPYYFSENQDDDNPHDELDPTTSAKIIIAHVADGVALAKSNKVPVDIHKYIREHHGDAVVASFYYKALENGNGSVNKSDFQYPGPKPSTKEAGILMICDSVEAAVKSIKEPSKDKIADMINKVMTQKIVEGQLSKAKLDTSDLETIRRVMTSFYDGFVHKRVEYPNIDELKKELALKSGSDYE